MYSDLQAMVSKSKLLERGPRHVGRIKTPIVSFMFQWRYLSSYKVLPIYSLSP